MTQREAYRGDIEGLRALAVGLVLVSHTGLGFLPGGFVGVDVFFVISGFLITGLLVSELRGTGRISLPAFYARRAKRLLPAAGLVLVATLALTVAFLPRVRWAQTAGDVVASGFYAMNWRLADRAVDYLAANEAPSMLQHYWSLAVEEQFYLFWPVLLLGVAWLSARSSRTRTWMLATIGTVAAGSFVWSILYTDAAPTAAYFVTTTRLWELAVGGVLALTMRHFARLGQVSTAILGWAGLVAVIGSAVWITPADLYPGYLALLPTLGTAAVIAAGAGGGGSWFQPERALGVRPMRAVGALSYSLYLWHWPLLVVAQARFGPLSPAAGAAVVALSVVPAVLAYRFVENPIHRADRLVWSPPRVLGLGAAFTVIPVLAALVLASTVWPQTQPAVALPAIVPGVGATTEGPTVGVRGAAVLGDNPRESPAGVAVDRVGTFTPDPVAAGTDLPNVYRDHCFATEQDHAMPICVYGDRDSTVTVALVGDSHAANWIPQLQDIAVAKKWRLVTYLRGACPFLDLEIAVLSRPQPLCTEWNTNVRAALTAPPRPKLLLTTGSYYVAIREGKLLTGADRYRANVAAMRRTWSWLADTGLPTVVIQDTPSMRVQVAECVSMNPTTLTKCATPRGMAVASSAGPAQVEAARGVKGVALVDLTDAICPSDPCAPVIGGVLVYRDNNHLTASYAATLTPRLAAALDRVG